MTVKREKLAVSACLLGIPCKYNGGDNYTPLMERLRAVYDLVPICPETLGGLTAPRPPAEWVGDRVLDREGRDVTDAFEAGARRALAVVLENGCKKALLKERSPSCGTGLIYDGSFTGRTIPGDGAAAALLRERGICLYGESALGELLLPGENSGEFHK